MKIPFGNGVSLVCHAAAASKSLQDHVPHRPLHIKTLSNLHSLRESIFYYLCTKLNLEFLNFEF